MKEVCLSFSVECASLNWGCGLGLSISMGVQLAVAAPCPMLSDMVPDCRGNVVQYSENCIIWENIVY